MKNIKKLYVFTVFLFVFVSCHDEMEKIEPKPVVHLDNGVGRGSTNAKISPYVDIDQTNLLLQYKNNNGVIQQVIPPWGSAVAVYATDNIRFDHFTHDGWVLVYNTFDVEQTNARPVLVLYNKYKGILRWWWYNDQVPAGISNFLTYALMIDGNSTSAFNFSDEFPKDYTQLKFHPFVTKTNTAAFNQGLLNQAWYYFDTEFAYDPSIQGKPQSNYSLALNAWATSTSKVTLSGDINGTINGTIDGSGSGLSLFNNLIGSITQTKYTNSIVRIDNGEKAKVSLDDKINSAISSGLADALKSNLNKLASQGLQILSSPLSNVFNSILSSSVNSQQKVELNLAAKINVSGDITADQPAMVFKGAVPGTQRGDLSGYVPYYNEILGAFNLSTPPVVRWRKVTIPTYPPPPYPTTDIQYLVDNTVAVVLNPAIANEVSISPISTQLVYMKSYSGKDPIDYPTLDPSTFNGWAVVNNVAGNVWYAFSAPYTIHYQYWSGTPERNIVVKIAFTITPNNGSSPVEVVKYYKPKFVPY